jgi:hypothetical protein
MCVDDIKDQSAFEEAQRFVSAIAGQGSLTFQTFDDSPAKRPGLVKVLHGSLDLHWDRLRHLNDAGGGVFLMINQGDGRNRRAENVTAVRALFVDLDGAPLEPVLRGPILPHLVTQTSPGRWHAYWLVEGVPLDGFSHLQAQLAKMFNADPCVKDLCRVMRIPGFDHCKGASYRTRLVKVDDKPVIAMREFVDAFGISPIIPTGNRNATMFQAASGFKHAGIPKAAAAARIAKINAAQTVVPLTQGELRAIVDNAYGYTTAGFSMIPHAIIDTPQFDGLSAGAVKLFLYAMRRHRPGKEFALPHSEFKHIVGFKNRKQFRSAIEELISAGFLVMTRNYVASVADEARRCALYRMQER